MNLMRRMRTRTRHARIRSGCADCEIFARPFFGLVKALIAVMICVPVTACSSEDPNDPARPTRSSTAPHTLDATFHYLRACREDRAYIELGEYVTATSRESTVALLQAMDALMVANRAALEAMRKSNPDIEVGPYDLSFLADLLDIFSRDVELISSEQQGESGTVTYEIRSHPSLAKAEFRKERGHWVYVPGPQDQAMTTHLREAADALTRLARRWEKTSAGEREIRNAYETRILPELRQAAATVAENQPSSSSSDSKQQVN